jgi:hypothetical protein
MRRGTRAFIISALVVMAFAQESASAQTPQGGCSQIKYSGPRAAARYRLDRIEGQAVYGAASEKGEFDTAVGVCVALFRRNDRRLIAALATDDHGQFQFTGVAPGEYMLVASLSALHEIAVPVRLVDGASGEAFKRWRLLLRMRSKEDRRKSFVTPVTNPALREELLRRAWQDQAVRDEMIKGGMNHPDKATEARMAVIDSDNMARMKEVVKRYGWPGPGLVGRDGADAAFLLVQHAPALAFQKAMLRPVRRAYREGELSAWNYALLLDRVLAREGKPQVYGMSVNHWDGQEPVLDPIMDEANVNRRRASIGLPPLSEYLEFMKKMYFPQGKDKK